MPGQSAEGKEPLERGPRLAHEGIVVELQDVLAIAGTAFGVLLSSAAGVLLFLR